VKTQSEQKEMTALLEQEAQQMRDELNAIAKSSLEETPIASPDQLVIGIGDQENSLLDEETLLKNYENTLAKLSNTGEVKGGQFSDLDVLLNQVGPILDQTKPILMPTDLLFEYNEDELQKGARQSLMKLGLLIQKNPRSTFIIEGHTDSTGPDDYNMELSRKRAGSVKRWLVDNLSIPEESLKIQAFGESRPLTNPNGAVEEQTLNRRVEIVILPPTD
jgi:outer membrane protein OmpA-like peptidoglycan-associated protein